MSRSRYLELCGLLYEDFKTQKVKFIGQDNLESTVDRYLNDFKQIKESIRHCLAMQ